MRKRYTIHFEVDVPDYFEDALLWYNQGRDVRVCDEVTEHTRIQACEFVDRVVELWANRGDT